MNSNWSTHFLAILDTGASPNFIHEEIFPPEPMELLERETLPFIGGATRRKLMMKDDLELKVQQGFFAPEVKFIVYEKFAVSRILRGDFCYRFVKAIFPEQKYIVFEEDSTLPIILKGARGNPREVDESDDEKFNHAKTPSLVVRLTRGRRVPAGKQV